MEQITITHGGCRYRLKKTVYENPGTGSACFTAVSDAFPGQTLFVKCIAYGDRKKLREQAGREAVAMQKVREVTNGVPKLLDHWDDSRRRCYYLVMEHLPGTTLKEWMQRNPAEDLSPGEVVFRLVILREICRILDQINRKYPILVHKDIKPENVMLYRKDKRTEFRLIDFGIAYTSFVKGIGTAGYQAPEQSNRGRDGSVRITCATDIFAVGQIGYELLSGTLPMPAVAYAMNPADKSWRIRPELHIASRESYPDAARIEELLQGMTEYLPEKRIGYHEILPQLNFLIARGKTRSGGDHSKE